jgi:hypothetical protein
MSALLERAPGSISQSLVLSRQFELRTIPSILVGLCSDAPDDDGYTITESVLGQVYGNVLNGWLYGAFVELSYNGSQPTWTSDDWAFPPVDLSKISTPVVQDIGSNSSREARSTLNLQGPSVNVTLDSSALRARIECTQVDVSNTSAWLQRLDFTNHIAWNQTTVPPGLKTGYSLGADGDGFLPLTQWTAWTTFFEDDSRIWCCSNETNGTADRAAIGYWSTNFKDDNGDPDDWTFDEASGKNFTVKWIVGKPRQQQASPLTYTLGGSDSTPQLYYVWEEPPQMTALNCLPIFETAEASVTVDLATSAVQSYSLATKPINAPAAWSDNWLQHNRSIELPPLPGGTGSDPTVNVTISYVPEWVHFYNM